jgi:hypothetical protein
MSWILRVIISFGTNTSQLCPNVFPDFFVLSCLFAHPSRSLVPESAYWVKGFFSFPTNTGGIVDVSDTLTSEIMFS